MMNIVKNKRAILMPETLKIILAVIGISILGYLAFSFYGMFAKSTASKQAEDSLEEIYSVVEKVKSDGKEMEIFLKSPNEWWIIAWTGFNGKIAGCNTDYCVCVCDLGEGLDYGSTDYLEKCGAKNKGHCKDFSTTILVRRAELGFPIQIKPLAPIKVYKNENKIILEGESLEMDKITQKMEGGGP